jgi:hypothetical protein
MILYICIAKGVILAINAPLLCVILLIAVCKTLIMKISSIVLFALLASASSCISKNDSSQNSGSIVSLDSATLKVVEGAKRCFRYVANGDTAFVTLREAGSRFSGSLIYRLKGKDKNIGLYSGRVQGDLIIGFYTFFSEGRKSVREEVFRRHTDSLIPAFGPIAQKEDTAYFQDKNTLHWNHTMAFKRTTCP